MVALLAASSVLLLLLSAHFAHIIAHVSVHEYSFGEAAKIVNCSPATLRRKLNKDGIKLGATKLSHGWRIPVTVLEALDLIDTVTTAGERSPKASMSDGERLELERLRERTRQQEQLIAVLRQQITDQRDAMRLIEARKEEPPKPDAPRPSLWRRLFKQDS